MASDQIKTVLEGNGFSPGFTPIPNELLDFIIPYRGEAETKVLLYVCRRTFGFGKDLDGISLGQICKGLIARSGRRLDLGTRLSKPAVIQAVRSLEDVGVLVSFPPSRRGRGAVKRYAVVLRGMAKALVEEIRIENETSRLTLPAQPQKVNLY